MVSDEFPVFILAYHLFSSVVEEGEIEGAVGWDPADGQGQPTPSIKLTSRQKYFYIKQCIAVHSYSLGCHIHTEII